MVLMRCHHPGGGVSKLLRDALVRDTPECRNYDREVRRVGPLSSDVVRDIRF